MPEILQDIGAYAGLASVVGLAALSVLYFSQARDVKRLREWAGRAPERAMEPGVQAAAVPGRVVPTPQSQPAAHPGAPPPVPGAPTPQAASAAQQATPGAKPATLGAKPATPAAQPATPGAKPETPAAKPTRPGTKPVAPAVAAATGAGAAAATAAGQAGRAPGQAGEGAAHVAAGATAHETAPGAAKPDAPRSPDAPAVATPGPQNSSGPTAPAAASGNSAGAPAPPSTAAGASARTAPAGPQKPGAPGPGTPGAGTAPGALPAPTAAGAPPLNRAGTPAPGRPAGAAAVPATAPRLPSRPGAGQQTEIIPPPREPWYRRLIANPRYVVLVVAGVLILGGGAAFAISQLAADDSDTPSAGRAQGGSGAPDTRGGDDGGDGGADQGDGGQKSRSAVNPTNVTVAVLNGTTVPGLAAQIADQVKSFGFQIGTVANGPDQQSQRAESVVLYAKGHEREAMAVGRKLKITQREPVDPESQGLAGDATVVVIAGGDRS